MEGISSLGATFNLIFKIVSNAILGRYSIISLVG